MKTKLFFALFVLVFALMSAMKAQPHISRIGLIAPDTICADVDPMVKLRRSSSFGFFGGSFSTYCVWDFGDGLSSIESIAYPVYHHYAVPGSYQVKVCQNIVNNGIWETACDSSVIVVQTNCGQGNVADLKMKVDSACVGYPIQFGDTLTGDLSYLSFLWDFGDGTYSTQGWGVKHTYNQTGVYAASLCIIDRNQQDTFCIQQLVPVKTCTPIQSLTIQGPDTVCVGTIKHDFEPIITGGSGNFHYRWDIPTTGTLFYQRDSTKQNISVGFTSMVNHVIKLSVTDLILGTVTVINDTVFTFPTNGCPLSVSIDGPGSTYCLSSGISPGFFANVAGGSGQYTYSWKSNVGGFTSTFDFFRPNYTAPGNVEIDLTVTDLQSLQVVHDTVTVNLIHGACANNFPSLILTLNPGSLCAGASFRYEHNRNYAYYPGFYVDFGDGTIVQNKLGTHTYAASGLYNLKTCVFNSATGDTTCSDRQVWVAPQCELELAVYTTEDYGNGDGTAEIDILRGNGAIEFQWDSSGVYQSAYELSGLAAGTYHLYARNGQGLTDTVTYVVPYSSSVFPGDCNHDQVADIQDLLPIGLHHGSWGLSRPNANLTWTAQPAPLWQTTQANGRDIRHVDTNGDGVITDSDTLAIQLNYGMTHNNLRGANTGPKLFYQMPAGPHSAGDTLRIPVHLATMDTPVVNLAGLTFGITYDTALVKAGSARFDFSNSWLGAKGTNMLTMYQTDTTRGEIEVGFVRKDQMDVSGYGRICDIIVVVDDHIGKREIPFRMGFFKPYGIDKQAGEVEIGYINGETSLTTTAIVSQSPFLRDISVGQTAEALHIYHPQEKAGTLQLFDMHGRLVLSQKLTKEGKSALITSKLTDGVYLVNLQSPKGVWRRKVVLF